MKILSSIFLNAHQDTNIREENPNETTIKAMKEAQGLMKNKKTKKFSNLTDLIKKLNS
uniref:hypothetical protein n=1 Tax=Ornithobacterium rhinotracheale TaxID=28251 RepID=UPI00129CFD2C|nr:hypothetical protein [Ornithobacterium rhinotracheale]